MRFCDSTERRNRQLLAAIKITAQCLEICWWTFHAEHLDLWSARTGWSHCFLGKSPQKVPQQQRTALKPTWTGQAVKFKIAHRWFNPGQAIKNFALPPPSGDRGLWFFYIIRVLCERFKRPQLLRIYAQRSHVRKVYHLFYCPEGRSLHDLNLPLVPRCYSTDLLKAIKQMIISHSSEQ